VSDERRVVLHDPQSGDVASPAVGYWLDPPRDGAWLAPGSRIGTLRRLNRDFVLVLPADASGRVVRGASAERVCAVEYAQTLFRLVPIEGAAGTGAGDGAAAGRGADLPAGTHAVVAPSDGVFYSRPGPEEAPFVEVGGRIHRGQPVGLVEVMKTFNQIVYGGPGLPEQAEVLELRCADGDEVAAGAVLLVVRAV